MKVIIKENEAGFLTRNGKFIKVLRAGSYTFFKSGYKVDIEEMTGFLKYKEIPYEILMQDEEFKSMIKHVEIPDENLGFLYIKNNLKSCLEPGEYNLWNVYNKYEVKLISTKGFEIDKEVTQKMLDFAPKKYYSHFQVPDRNIGFFYINNSLKSYLEPGEYKFWTLNETLEIKNVSIDNFQIGKEITKQMLSIIPEEYYTHYQIPDGSLGFLYINGNLKKCFEAGEYYFWTRYENCTMKLVEIGREEIDKEITKQMTALIPEKYYTHFKVPDKFIGFLYINNKLKSYLEAGEYNFWNIYDNYSIDLVSMEYARMDIRITEQMLSVVPKEYYVKFQIPDGKLGLVYSNGNLSEYLDPGEYYYWTLYEKPEVKLISMENTEISSDITNKMLSVIPKKYYTTITVSSGEAALLYYNEVLQKVLEPGVYNFWNEKIKVTTKIVDMKQTEINISGQEILTKDKIGIRMNVTCSYKIKDAVAVTENIGNLTQEMYSFIQLVIRELTGNHKLDEILELKEEISKEIYEKLKEKQDEFYVEFKSAGIKDIILPGEIKDIMNSVLIAEKKAQANVIARREEVASTRSLLNTAKLMEENKTLYKLKELEYLEKICEKVGEISINGSSGIIEQLGALLGNK